jgi:uncharacterized phage protein (TIGR01671 family)|nr:MAG TPA: YopX protein [Caudoviricetes sp.]DAZ67722.1 MAG TPA: YopX protein [Caudoviricetes sp.]
MREIKFRGHNGGEWLYDSIISIQQYGNVTHCFMPNEKNKSDQDDINNWDGVCYVGEYTGCKDGNGVEIYEGDIVRRPAYSEEERDYIGDIVGLYHIPEKIGEVIMYEGAWCLKFELNEKKVLNPFFEMMEFDRFDLIEVIGNIYENKNLLEEE